MEDDNQETTNMSITAGSVCSYLNTKRGEVEVKAMEEGKVKVGVEG
jgi:chorismate-pyruvate lyase